MKWLALGLVALLEFSAIFYIYHVPAPSLTPGYLPPSTVKTKSSSTTTTTTTTTTHPLSDHIAVKSAVISNDTLRMVVHNSGPSATQQLTITSVCTPKFQTCYDYKKLAGKYYQILFVLPAGRNFMVNLTGVCTVPISSGPSPYRCMSYYPVANMSYYLQVKFSFADGVSVQVPVSAKANNTWTPYPTAITGIWPSLTIVPKNLTGMLNVTLAVNDSIPWGSFTTQLDQYRKPSNPFSGIVLSNKTGCMNSAFDPDNFTDDGHRGPGINYTADCTEPVLVSVGFTTVLTGIAPGTLYLLVVRDTTDIDKADAQHISDTYPNLDWPYGKYHADVNFALWIQGFVNSTK